MSPILSVSGLRKTYASGFEALKSVDLEIKRGEIFALLGPNGAGKSTLINIICGVVNPSAGTIIADGHDIVSDWRAARQKIGLVPQELTTDAFETVWATTSFSRGLFGKPRNDAHIEKILKQLSLWDKKDAKIMTLSGGMKRRVMIAKALSHEPEILFLDEPSAGVDVELRRDMWEVVRKLRDGGVTVILTTHYIQEAEEMADRIGVINHGEIILVENKAALMKKLGKKRLTLNLHNELKSVPNLLSKFGVELADGGNALVYTFDSGKETTGIADLLKRLDEADIEFTDLHTQQSSLEDIFVDLCKAAEMNLTAIQAIYRFEMARAFRTLWQSIVSPVISTSLYFVVFGAAIGGHMAEIGQVSYGAFIVPGLIMMALLTMSISNASFGIFFPKFTGTIYEILSAPVSAFEIVAGYVGAAATKSIIVGLITLVTARLFVDFEIAHPFVMALFLVLTAITFSLFGFVIGIWADGFEKLQFIPLLVITPLTFLGGSFYSIDMLPPVWRVISLFNPLVYLISGFRWSFHGQGDVHVGISLAMTAVFLAICIGLVMWIFRTGYRLKN